MVVVGGGVRNKTNGLNITIIYIFCYCLTGKIYLVCDFISGLHSAVVRKRFVNHLFTSCFVFCGPETTGCGVGHMSATHTIGFRSVPRC